MGGECVMIVAGGDPVGPDRLTDLPTPDFVIAADSGFNRALALGVRVDLLVGDLDSASESALETARATGLEIVVHPAAKDQSDLELALLRAQERDPARVLVVGGGGGRLDHLLANVSLLAHSEAAPHLEWVTDEARVLVVRNRAEVWGRAGDLITLLAYGDPVAGARTTGLAWELRGERLEPGSTRGVSNVFRKHVATISVEEGTLLVVIPVGE